MRVPGGRISGVNQVAVQLVLVVLRECDPAVGACSIDGGSAGKPEP